VNYRKLLRFLPSIFWMAVIFHFSSISTAGIGATAVSRYLILKSFHLIEYAALGILLYFGYNKFKWSLAAAYLYALSDEVHQFFVPGRSSKFTDTLIDLIGIFIGLMILKLILRYRRINRFFT
jgi:VanZ family protein